MKFKSVTEGILRFDLHDLNYKLVASGLTVDEIIAEKNYAIWGVVVPLERDLVGCDNVTNYPDLVAGVLSSKVEVDHTHDSGSFTQEFRGRMRQIQRARSLALTIASMINFGATPNAIAEATLV